MNCKSPFVLSMLLSSMFLWPVAVQAQNTIFRCGNAYTNNASEAKAKGCKPIEGGNLSVVETPKRSSASSKPAAARGNGNDRVDGAAQKARDADARAILEAELRKAEARLAEVQGEYADGHPDKIGPEFKNYQLYQNRVAEIKERLERARADVEGIRRELARLDGAR
jgi:predicted lipid-binding transport protein (Tim44 family)